MAETPQGHRDAGQVRADAERELNEQLDETRQGAGERELETEQERQAREQREREERERVAGQPV